jgi:hypothetical protein
MAPAPEQSPGPGSPLSGGTAARLAAQLQTLAQLGETLTYRLLELEERLAEQQQRLAPLFIECQTPDGQVPGGAAAGLGGRMADTEQRLGRIEALLAGLDPGSPAPRFQDLPGPPSATGRFAHGPEPGDDPGDLEGVQPSPDERSA